MGGNAFTRKGIHTIRLPLEKYQEVSARILADLELFCPDLQISMIPHYRSKTDFGDLDILVGRSILEQFSPDAICVALSGVAWHRNSATDPVLSIAIETGADYFQIDLITAPADEFDYCRRFLSWGDAGALTSGIARQMGLKHGRDGLSFVFGGVYSRQQVPLSVSYDDALEFLGLDPDAHQDGFDTPEQVYAWIAGGRYFDPAIYQPLHLTNERRRRVKDRPFYLQFLGWMEGLSARYEWGPRDSRRDEWAKIILARFPDAAALVDEAIKNDVRDRSAELFNGKNVARISGETGLRLSHLMNAIRKELGDRLVEIERKGDRDELEAAIGRISQTNFMPEHITP